MKLWPGVFSMWSRFIVVENCNCVSDSKRDREKRKVALTLLSSQNIKVETMERIFYLNFFTSLYFFFKKIKVERRVLV